MRKPSWHPRAEASVWRNGLKPNVNVTGVLDFFWNLYQHNQHWCVFGIIVQSRLWTVSKLPSLVEEFPRLFHYSQLKNGQSRLKLRRVVRNPIRRLSMASKNFTLRWTFQEILAVHILANEHKREEADPTITLFSFSFYVVRMNVRMSNRLII